MRWRSPGVAAALIGLAVAATVFVGLLAVHHAPKPALTRTVAVRDALRVTQRASGWRNARWDRITVAPIDSSLTRVAFWSGEKIVGELALRRNGTADQTQLYVGRTAPFGNPLAYQPAVLVLLGALFILGSAVVPVARVRNADVLAAGSLVAPVVLLAHRYVGASVLTALPGLLWLSARGARLALRGPTPERPATPLLDALTPRWSAVQRVRLLRMLVLALALVYLMVSVSSTGPVDVVYGVMEGASKLLHGILPYGHLPGDVIHGDTYPIASYALYVPLAWLAPVRSTWDSVDLALGASAALALLAAGLARVAARRAAGSESRAQDAAGLRAALTWLAFPPLLVAASSGTSDLLLAALVIAAVCSARRPALGAGLLALGGWVKLAPFALLPIWLAARRGAALRSAVAAVAAVSAAAVALLVALGGVNGPAEMIHAISFQFTRGSPQSVWSTLDVARLQLVAQAALVGAVAAAALYVRRRPAIVEDPVRLAGLVLAGLIWLELAADYWSVLYLVWIAGLLPLSVLRPSYAAAEARTATDRLSAAPLSAVS